MTDREYHIQRLFTAELQFRLASAVRLAVTWNRQPLDLPMEWTHGQHRVRVHLTARDRTTALAAIERQLTHEPLKETRNRKPLRPNPIAPWE